ncbi:MAG: NUDIX domain-containing protein [Candidatus Saccharimonadales bacterium]
MENYRIVMTLIEQGDNYVLQRRDSNPNIGAAGLVGCFGGKIETGEAPKAAAAREVSEETSLKPNPVDLEFVGEVDVVSDRNGQPIQVNSQVFRLTVDPDTKIEATDGQRIIYAKDGAESHLSEMTPATRATFQDFILKEKHGSEHH